MRKIALAVALRCFKMTTLDGPWQSFGYRRRPTYGAYIQKLRRRWKVAIEKKVSGEMLIAYTACHILAEVVSVDDLEDIFNFYTSDLYGMRQVCIYGHPALGHTCRAEALTDLRNSTDEYLQVPPDQWCKVLLRHISPASVPNERLAAQLIYGCARFGSDLGDWIGTIRDHPDKFLTGIPG